MESTVEETKVFSMLDNLSPPGLWANSGCNQSPDPLVDISTSTAGDALLSCLSDKPPISLLQELCVKRGLSPRYELIESEGPVHERIFTYRVAVGTLTATGKGTLSCFVHVYAHVYVTDLAQTLTF